MARNELLNEPFTASDGSIDTWMASAHSGWSNWNANADGRVTISSNAVTCTSSSDGLYKLDDVAATDQYVGIKVSAWSAASSVGALLGVRLTGTGGSRSGVYAEIVENSGATYVHIAKVTSGTTSADTYPSGFGGFVPGTDSFFIEAAGDDLLLYINSTLISTQTGFLAAHTTGSVGFGIRSAASLITVDDLKAGDFAAAPVITGPLAGGGRTHSTLTQGRLAP